MNPSLSAERRWSPPSSPVNENRPVLSVVTALREVSISPLRWMSETRCSTNYFACSRCSHSPLKGCFLEILYRCKEWKGESENGESAGHGTSTLSITFCVWPISTETG